MVGLKVRLLMGLVMGLMVSVQSWAAVQASVDRNKIYDTETLVLTLTVTGDEDAAPDLDGLKADFDLLSTSQSSSYRYINGQMSSKKSWFVTLAPKRQGTLRIPAIAVGSEMSKPITVDVLAPSAAEHLDEVPAIFIETEVDPRDEAYVQGQIAFSLKIFYATELQSGRLSELVIDNAVVQPLGDDKSYQALRHGKRFNVIERRYAIFPQASGPLTIPQMSFQGSVRVAQAGRRRVDPFFDPFGRLGSSSQQVRVKSEPLTLTVKPRPATAKGPWWLPARELKLVEKWAPDPPVFRVGEPVTRTITLQAQGLSAAQLPDVALAGVTQVKFYPDQAVTQDADDGAWIIGTRQQKVALVPVEAGQYTLPAIDIRWWDTAADRERVATLPARQITVLPALNAPGPELPEPDTTGAEPKEAAAQLPVVITPQASGWPYVAAGFALAWLVTLVAWARQRRLLREGGAGRRAQSRPSQGGGRNAARRAVKRACDKNDAKAAKTALLQWAAEVAAGQPLQPPPQSLGQVAQWFDHAGQAQINELDRVLYSFSLDLWDGQTFWQTLSPQMSQLAARQKGKKAGALAPLYPEK
ncbi:MAG TPA: protein BatD [Candidatus Tenderia sp.]|nr:protein BatD [Candidatus Tenderia sp.]